VIIIFLLGIAVVFLVLAAQFESFIHPQIIILTVPLAVLGGLLGLLFSGGTLNLYTQVGLIVLVGIASKNGILIVEFINQLRDRGVPFEEAVLTGSATRLRPILMTAVTTVASSVALLVSTGPGSETRVTIGFVIFFGVSVATVFSLVIVPTMYRLLARNTGSPGDVAKKLAEESA
jgi:multidrug efflux pump